jgi:hypothetical protein
MRGRYDKESSFYIDEGRKIQYQASGTILCDLPWTFSFIHKYRGLIAGWRVGGRRGGTDEVLVTDLTGCKSLGRAYYTDSSNFLHLRHMFIDT